MFELRLAKPVKDFVVVFKPSVNFLDGLDTLAFKFEINLLAIESGLTHEIIFFILIYFAMIAMI